MRVLLAYDGSPTAVEALALADAIDWPAGSVIRVVGVVEPRKATLPAPWGVGDFYPVPDFENKLVAYAEDQIRDAVSRLRRHGVAVEGAVARGPAATVIDEAARTLRADLAIVGSHGHGLLASLLLGSVSAEVVDHAGSPVLVARQRSMDRVLFATDGSPSALAAERILGEWMIFDRVPIRVLSVADVVAPWHTGIAPPMYRQALDAYARDVDDAEAAHALLAEDSARRLRARGRRAEACLRTGDAATEIVEAAADWGTDLVAMGSRGISGFKRVVLGSVARDVLHDSHASVLVVHEEEPASNRRR
jgi:nucleotide-binding universal stress UspA family protein